MTVSELRQAVIEGYALDKRIVMSDAAVFYALIDDWCAMREALDAIYRERAASPLELAARTLDELKLKP